MKAITKYWFLEGFNLFKKLGMPSMMKLCNLLEMEHVDKGNIIDMGERDKNCIFFLKNGSVKIIDSENNIVKYVVKKGNIFGELSIYDKDNSSKEVAIALEDVVICYIESDMMEGLMEEYKSLKNGLLKIYGLRIRKLETRLQDLLYKDSKTRISEFIKVFIEEFGEVEKDRIVAKNLLSHKDIANLTNTSRQTVNNVLSIMRKENIIDYDSKFISYSKKTI
ncbi:Crp/Fnr family transcriptional regulator [Maribacter dokdonensis]|uniref:Crp/Fnr family transcriptional regulator n=1 Tax=Maribacter dokdonensis TaxID=320912 RepID=UPI002AB316FC|nr:Crp/Fnr family transcriptional regulator [Maribacter dokdonensis]